MKALQNEHKLYNLSRCVPQVFLKKHCEVLTKEDTRKLGEGKENETSLKKPLYKQKIVAASGRKSAAR